MLGTASAGEYESWFWEQLGYSTHLRMCELDLGEAWAGQSTAHIGMSQSQEGMQAGLG